MMGRYHFRKGKSPHQRRRLSLLLGGSLLVLVMVVLGFGFTIKHKYELSLQPVSNDQTTSLFTVNEGESVKTIALHLEQQHLIRSAEALEIYVHGKGIGSSLQAGTYAFSPSENPKQIVSTLTKGKVSTRLVTIIPGRRIDQVRADLINDGFTPSAVDTALNPAQYTDLPLLALKPANVTTLEGLLWPDSFQKDATTQPATIIRESLQEMSDHLTAEVKAGFSDEGLTPYQGLILTSVITQEVSKPTDQVQVAQVFLTRLKSGMQLGSDVTANYGAVVAGLQPNLSYDSPYNTLLHTGLPPTPISSITASALAAATHPANTTWLYFVTGDDGTTYFSSTLQDHQALTQKYCHKLCSQ